MWQAPAGTAHHIDVIPITGDDDMTIALITGGSRGLGRSAALHLARNGVGIVLTYQNNATAAEEVVAAIAEDGGKAVALQLDTGDTKAFPQFADEVRRILSNWGAERFNYLVNMAGTSHTGLLGEVTEEDFDAAYRIHLKGPFFLTQTLLPLIADGGRIVNISSGLTRIIYPGRVAYASMKGAVEVMTRYMAKELGPHGVRVNAIVPGPTETPLMWANVPADEVAATRAQIEHEVPLGRLARPEEIAEPVLWLLSDRSSYTTGSLVGCDGGVLAKSSISV